MGKSGVITEEFRGEENASYHDIVALFKIYRSVNWRMQIKINQVRHRFEIEYGITRTWQENENGSKQSTVQISF